MAGPFRVLLANEAHELRRLVRRALEQTRHFVVVAEAANGAEALQQVQEHRPDLALLDLALPVLDGLGALAAVREAAPECTVVVISAFETERIPAPVAHSADLCLPEGISPQRLVAELLSVLQPSSDGEVASDGIRRASTKLTVDVTSPRTARHFLSAQLSAWNLDDLRDTAELLVSELVTNAIVHAHSPSQLVVHADGDSLHVVVEDWGGGALVLRDPDPLTPGGRGLRFVEALSTRWGTATTGHGKSVWFELPLIPDPARVVEHID